jgi:RecA/RadA recombinase
MISPLLRLPFLFSLPLFSSAWARQSLPLRSKAVSFMSKSSAAEEVGSPQLKILGVCGGIGSGKSTACKLLVSELNCAAHIGKSYKSSQVAVIEESSANSLYIENGVD